MSSRQSSDSDSDTIPKAPEPKKTSQIAKKRKSDQLAAAAAAAAQPKKAIVAGEKKKFTPAKKAASGGAKIKFTPVRVGGLVSKANAVSTQIDQAIDLMEAHEELSRRTTASNRLADLRKQKSASKIIDIMDDTYGLVAAAAAAPAAAAASASAATDTTTIAKEMMENAASDIKEISTATTGAEAEENLKPGDYEKTITVRRRLNNVPVTARSSTYYRDMRYMYEMQSRLYAANRRRLNQSRNRQTRLADRAFALIEEMHETGADCAFVYMRNSQRPAILGSATPRMRWMLDDARTKQSRSEIFDTPHAEEITYITSANMTPYAFTAKSTAPTPGEKPAEAAAAAAAAASSPAAASTIDRLAKAFDDDVAPPMAAVAAPVVESMADSDDEHIVDAENLML